MQRRAARIVASAPKIPLLGALITSGVGLTGVLLALVGYNSALAMLGGSTVATLVWIALYYRELSLAERQEA
ncbi:MAG TPA: hypothetical protein VHC19_29740 [Pirellulales bacterium]|nr:hypothetical protein [Pirellulales bacterium]